MRYEPGIRSVLAERLRALQTDVAIALHLRYPQEAEGHFEYVPANSRPLVFKTRSELDFYIEHGCRRPPPEGAQRIQAFREFLARVSPPFSIKQKRKR